MEVEKMLDYTGQQVGAYRVLKQIGRGGMGSVYLAERVDGQFDQNVALKVINPGMDSKEVLNRFRTERQITARLQHPNIARLLDGGITNNGLPFFTMEYVNGKPIDEYCRERNVSLDQKLELFVEVCKAVQYAHRNLIIHRDLKPSNILVEESGSVKLLDFGIAKLIDPNIALSEEPNLTRTGMRVMSPAYASPEQVRCGPISISSDIYSLGVVLYKLLTNQLPHDISGLGITDIERRICETDPEKPSRRVESTENGSRNPAVPGHPGRKLRGDLDVVCLKCLQKEPERRYHSAEQLADDIQRYLSGAPISARIDSVGYTMRKFIGRNLGMVITAVAVLVLIATVIGVYTGKLASERNVARSEAEVASQITGFLMSLFEVSSPGLSRGETVTARELLERGSMRIDEELAGQPEIQARLMHVLGQIYYTLGMYDHSKDLAEKALAHGLDALDPDDPRIAEYKLTLAWLLDEEGSLDSAETLAREALEINLSRFGEFNLQTGKSYHDLAMVLRHKGEFESAGTLYLRALAIKRAIPDIDSIEIAHTLNHYARLKYQTGDIEGSIPYYREALKIREDAHGTLHPETMASMAGLAGASTKIGNFEEAISLYQQCLKTVETTSGAEHPHYGDLQNSLAHAFKDKGDIEKAERYHRAALETHRNAHPNGNWRISTPLLGLGILLSETGRAEESLEHLNEARNILSDSFGEGHWRIGTADLALGECLTKLGRYQEAEVTLLRAYECLTNSFDKDNSYVIRNLESVIQLYSEWGMNEKALEYENLKSQS